MPEDFLPKGEIKLLFPGKVLDDNFPVSTSEIVDVVGEVLASVYLSIKMSDLVDDFQCGNTTKKVIPV